MYCCVIKLISTGWRQFSTNEIQTNLRLIFLFGLRHSCDSYRQQCWKNEADQRTHCCSSYWQHEFHCNRHTTPNWHIITIHSNPHLSQHCYTQQLTSHFFTQSHIVTSIVMHLRGLRPMTSWSVVIIILQGTMFTTNSWCQSLCHSQQHSPTHRIVTPGRNDFRSISLARSIIAALTSQDHQSCIVVSFMHCTSLYMSQHNTINLFHTNSLKRLTQLTICTCTWRLTIWNSNADGESEKDDSNGDCLEIERRNVSDTWCVHALPLHAIYTSHYDTAVTAMFTTSQQSF